MRGRRRKSASRACRVFSDLIYPFFLRLAGAHERISSLRVEYTVTDPSPGVAYCSALSIPFLHGRGYAQITQVLGGVSLFCRSHAREVLGLLADAAIGGGALLLVLVVLDCCGVVSVRKWFCCDEEKQRFAALKKDPYANEIFEE